MSTTPPANPLTPAAGNNTPAAAPAMVNNAPPAAPVPKGPTQAGVSAEPVIALPQPNAGQSGPKQNASEKKPAAPAPANSGLFGLGFLGLGGSRRRRRGSKRSRRSKKTRKTRGKRKGGRR